MFGLLSMRRLAILLVAAVCLYWAPQVSAWTGSVVQHPRGTCNVTPCTLTVASTTAGDAGFIIYLDQSGGIEAISSVSDGSSTWVVNASCKVRSGAVGNMSAAYTLSLAGGITSITTTIAANGFNGEVEFLEYSGRAPLTFDSCNASANASSATPPGQGLTLTGASDVIVQAIDSAGPQNATAITGAYTTPADFPFSGPSQGGYGIAGAVNTNTGTAPTWTLNGANSTIVLAIALTETPTSPNTGGQFISSVMLPQVTPISTYPPDTGYTITAVASGANLQTAINAAACGTKLNLAHNGTFSAGILNLPNLDVGSNACACHTDQTKWRIIQGDQFEANYTPGVRTDPSMQYLQYPHISSNDTNYTFYALAAANCWGFAGLDVTETTDGANSVFSWGDGSFSQANFPTYAMWWGDYVHGFPTKSLTRCLMLNGSWETVVDSYISDCHRLASPDSQGIAGWDGFGPELVQNNFIEASHENFIEGGSIPHTPGTVPSDFTFKNNHLFKPLAWYSGSPTYAGIHWQVKNLFENKNVSRELITANYFQNNWSDAQNGVAFPFDEENANSCPPAGTNPAASLSDVTFFYNILQNSAGVGNIATSASNACNLNQPDHRMSFHDNLYYGIDECLWAGCGSLRLWNMDATPPTSLFDSYDITFNHETYSSANMAEGFSFGNVAGFDLHYGFTVTNSVLDGGAFGVFFGSGSAGNSIIANYIPAANLTYNCGYNTTAFGNLPNFAHSQTPTNQAAIFNNPGTDWHVAPTSVCFHAASDGLSMGANIDAVNSATAGVVQTLGCPVTVTNVSPSTFTHTGGTGLTLTGSCFQNESALAVIIGGAGPSSAVSTNSCGTISPGQFTITAFTDTSHFTYTGGCVVVMASPVSVALNDSIIAYLTVSGGVYTENIDRITPGNACTSVMVTSSTTITCTTPAATGTVTTGPVSVFVSQWGIPVQSTVFGNYN